MKALQQHVMFEYVSMELLWILIWDFASSLPNDLIRYIFDYFCLFCCQEDHSVANGALVARRLFATKLKYRVKRCKFCGDAQYVDALVPHKLNRTHRFRLTPGEIVSYLSWLEDTYFKYTELNCIRLDFKCPEKHKLSNLLSIYGWELQDTPFEQVLIPHYQTLESQFEQGIKRKREAYFEPLYKRMRIQ